MDKMNFKKLLSVSLLFFMILGTLTSCSRDDGGGGLIWDIVPLYLQIEVVDGAGHNLVDPANPNHILNTGITATFKGKTYELYDIKDFALSRAYMPMPYGLVYKADYDGKYVLFFGEFEGTSNYNHELVMIDWKDGTKSEIKIDYKFKWKNNNPKIKEKIWLDGKEVTRKIKIVK